MGFREGWRSFWGIEEAKTPAPPQKLAAPPNTARRGFEAQIPVGGLTETAVRTQGNASADRQTMMVDLYDAYLACSWSWTAVNAIGRTVTGGGLRFTWDNDKGGPGDAEEPEKPIQVQQCERLLEWCNPREDIIQLLRSTVADLQVFGDAFIEVVWAGGIPVALYTLDCPSTSPIADSHGNVTGYLQITQQGQEATFKPHEVIHISLDAPRSGIFGVSPTYAALLPIKIHLFASAVLKELFRKGLPPTIHADLPATMSPAEQTKWVEQYQVRNIGPLNIGRPVVTRGGGTINQLQPNKIAEILSVLDQQRDAILAAYGVPPAQAGVIETGNIGGGTGESQRKMFEVNTCKPIAALILEKLNFVLKSAFGIDDWSLHFDEVDMRDSKTVEDIRDLRLRNGSWTLDRYRTEIGEPATPGGDQPILVDRQGVVVWRDMEAYSTANIAAAVKGTDLETNLSDGDSTEGKPLTLRKTEKQEVPPELAAHAAAAAGAPPGQQPGQQPADADQKAQAAKAAKAPPPEKAAQGKGAKESWVIGSAREYNARLREALAELDGADRAA